MNRSLRQKPVLPDMHNDMNKESKDKVLARWRRRYRTAGLEHKSKLLDQAVAVLGYHRKAAIGALGGEASGPPTVGLVLGRPRTYHAETLLPVLKAIWFTAFQPCGKRLAALLAEWLPGYEADHRRLDADVRQALLAISARTLDRLLGPLRVAGRRRGGTRPRELDWKQRLRRPEPVSEGEFRGGRGHEFIALGRGWREHPGRGPNPAPRRRSWVGGVRHPRALGRSGCTPAEAYPPPTRR